MDETMRTLEDNILTMQALIQEFEGDITSDAFKTAVETYNSMVAQYRSFVELKIKLEAQENEHYWGFWKEIGFRVLSLVGNFGLVFVLGYIQSSGYILPIGNVRDASTLSKFFKG